VSARRYPRGRIKRGRSKIGGSRFRRLVARYVALRFAKEGLRVYEEVALGSSIIGKARQVDLLVLNPDGTKALALEVKYQGTQGTTDEKIVYALQDVRTMRLPAAIVYAGSGWSQGVLHLMESAEEALKVRLEDGQIVEARELDVFVAATFGLWDVVVGNKKFVQAEV
jgi:hypothetical protein